MITKVKSITHEHILCILNTELNIKPINTVIKILDVGCGDGHLIGDIFQNLPLLTSDLTYELYGFDVFDHGVQSADYMKKTLEYLYAKYPCIPWKDRITCISVNSSWPYPDRYFDVVISNQVIEHIKDHDKFTSEVNRVLKNNGISIHLFHLKEHIFERHLNLPLVHKILNTDLLITYIKLFSAMMLGKYRIHKKSSNISLSKYAERHADYIAFYTNYISYKNILLLAKRNGLRGSFRYTGELYANKLRSLLNINHNPAYKLNRSYALDFLSVHFYKYVSIVTLFLEKKESYTNSEDL